MPAVDLGIAALVYRHRPLEHVLRHRALEASRQRARDEIGDALADEGPDHLHVELAMPHLAQHGVGGDGEVGYRIDERAVEIDHYRFYTEWKLQAHVVLIPEHS